MTSTHMTDIPSLAAAHRAATGNRPLAIAAFGQGLSAFFVVSYAICILGYLVWPDGPAQHASLGIFLPGFTLLSWHTFFPGFAESFAWGWYIALVFGPLYNFFLRRAG